MNARRLFTLLTVLLLILSAGIFHTMAQCTVDGIDSASCDGDENDNDIEITGEITETVDAGAGNDTVDMTGGGSIVTNGEEEAGVLIDNSDNPDDGDLTVEGGTISTTGDLAHGIYTSDSGDVTNSSSINANGDTTYGIRNNSSEDVTNNGSINTNGRLSHGIYNGNSGDVTNNGSINTQGDGASGIFNSGSEDVTNNGSINTDNTQGGGTSYGIANNNSGDVTNNGSINTQGDDTSGIFNSGSEDVTNNGSINTQGSRADGIYNGNSGDVTNNGSINTQGDAASGISNNNSGDVTNNGSISVTGADSVGIATDAGYDRGNEDTVTNNGSISAADGPAISTGKGDDTVTTNNNVSGLIDGGEGRETLGDTLNVTGGGCTSGGPDDNAAIESAGGTGAAFGIEWANFEIVNGQTASQDCSGTVQFDGRLNTNVSVIAPVAMYCATSGDENAIFVYGIDANVQGFLIMAVLRSDIDAALVQASTGGVSIIIAEANGATFRATSDGLLTMTAPYLTAKDGIYFESFDGTQCA